MLWYKIKKTCYAKNCRKNQPSPGSFAAGWREARASRATQPRKRQAVQKFLASLEIWGRPPREHPLRPDCHGSYFVAHAAAAAATFLAASGCSPSKHHRASVPTISSVMDEVTWKTGSGSTWGVSPDSFYKKFELELELLHAAELLSERQRLNTYVYIRIHVYTHTYSRTYIRTWSMESSSYRP